MKMNKKRNKLPVLISQAHLVNALNYTCEKKENKTKELKCDWMESCLFN